MFLGKKFNLYHSIKGEEGQLSKAGGSELLASDCQTNEVFSNDWVRFTTLFGSLLTFFSPRTEKEASNE